MLEKILDRMRELPKAPFIADKGYDAVKIIQKVIEHGCEPAIGIKQTFRMGVRDPLRKLSLEGVFGSIKQNLGSTYLLTQPYDCAKINLNF